MPGGPAGRRALFGLLFLLSGLAGLIYEQLWIRLLQHVFGSTIHSITTVVAAYMGGLGIGAWVLGRRADAHPRPVLLYGRLELAIGAFGLASPWIIGAIGSAYLAFAQAVGPGLWAATAVKAVTAFAVMLLPTILMGGTLPVLTRAFAGAGTRGLRRELALFYGLNTIGGVAGCALAGYVLVEYAGIRPSLLAVGTLNLLIGVAALVLGRGAPARGPAPDDGEDTGPAASIATRRTAAHLIGVTAFASLLFEIAWTRVLILVVGSSTYAFTTILACFLLGIGIGSLVTAGRGLPAAVLLQRSAVVLGAAAALASLLFPLFRMLPVFIILTLRLEASPGVLLALQALPVALVVIPPAIGFGMVFPLLTELAARREAGPGRETGRAYLANTVGSIVGSAVTGFVLIHTMGSERTLVAGVAVVAAGAVVLHWLWGRAEPTGWRAARLAEHLPALLAAAAVLVAVVTPGWSRRLLDRGPAIYGHDIRTASQMDAFLRGLGGEQLSFEEGWNATISVWRSGNYAWLKTNGKADASSVADMNTQVLLGVLPALAHPEPRRALVIGFGSGTTARALADAPDVQAVEVVEIERAVLRAAPFFADVNRDVLADPRVRIIEDDARSALQLGGLPYDLVVSEPSNPWVAGVAGLFTPEFFGVVRDRLAEDGVFAQWVQMYRIDMSVVAVVVSNLRRVFPHVEMWYANSADLVLLASRRPLTWDRSRTARFLAPGTASAALLQDWLLMREPDDLLGRFVMGDRGTAVLARDARLRHDDDRPALEFVAARGLLAANHTTGIFDSLFALRDAVGDTLPALRHWPLGPGAWEWSYARALPDGARAARPMADRALAALPRDPARRGEIGRFEHQAGRDSVALPLLREAAGRLPRDARLGILAGSAAWAMGDSAAASALLERARGGVGDTVLATSILAEWAVRRGDYERGAAEAIRAIQGLRPTLAAPFPGALQSAVQRLAVEGPPDVAAPVLDLAARARPGWDLAWWGGALTHARRGGAHCRRARELGASLGRFGWSAEEVEELLARCPAT